MPDSDATPFRDAESWLAERGVRREEIRVAPSQAPDDSPAGPDVSVREAVRLATETEPPPVPTGGGVPAETLPPVSAETSDGVTGRLEDDVAAAVAFVRRSTANAPQSEGRLRDKLSQRWPDAVVRRAIARAREERLVDDDAFAAALVEEGRRKGHAPTRLRATLRQRGFDDAIIERALAPLQHEDQEAAAFAVAQAKAATTTGLSAEAAFRRVVSHLARRGYPEGLARKVARQAVFAARDPERTAGH